MKEERNDVIEIPVGKFLGKIRGNPWMPAAFVLAVALIVVVSLWAAGGGSGNITGNVIGESEAGDNLISFINAQGRGTAELVSVDENEGFYEVMVKYDGQDVPVLVTLDGKYLVANKIPLSGEIPAEGTAPEQPAIRNVSIGDSPIKGSKDARVTIIEFSDYECPFCGRYFQETYAQLKKDYIDTGKVKYVFKDFPLSFHESAQKAAEAARCVREQKGDFGYFAMHDKLFSSQDQLSVENYKNWARELGVDGSKYDSCLDSGKYAQAVQSDLEYGQQVGVEGTPAFFINGKLVSGAQPYSVFKQAIDAELAG